MQNFTEIERLLKTLKLWEEFIVAVNNAIKAYTQSLKDENDSSFFDAIYYNDVISEFFRKGSLPTYENNQQQIDAVVEAVLYGFDADKCAKFLSQLESILSNIIHELSLFNADVLSDFFDDNNNPKYSSECIFSISYISKSSKLLYGNIPKYRELFTDQIVVNAAKSPKINGYYEYNSEYISKVYNYCIDTFTFKDITLRQFMGFVANADFREIYYRDDVRVLRIKTLIYAISRKMEDIQWYNDTAHSIDTEPDRCSGAQTSKNKWKNQLFSIK